MTNSSPLFSIVIPTYNRGNLLPRTIESALKQTFTDFEIIVVDDGSTDNTERIIKEKFPFIHYIKTPNRERGSARNTGAEHSSGKYVYFLDSDDLLYPNHLQKAFHFMMNNSKPEWFFQEYALQKNNQLRAVVYNKSNPIDTLIKNGNFLSCHGVFIRKDVFDANKFDEDRRLAGSEDYELWLRLASKYPLRINPIVTSLLVEHEDRSVMNFNKKNLIDRKLIMLDKLKKNQGVTTKFGRGINYIKSNSYSYIALHLAMMGYKNSSIRYFMKSLFLNPALILSKRFYAIVLKLIKVWK